MLQIASVDSYVNSYLLIKLDAQSTAQTAATTPFPNLLDMWEVFLQVLCVDGSAKNAKESHQVDSVLYEMRRTHSRQQFAQ